MRTKEFLRILKVVKSAVANRELLEQSTSFVFKDGKIHAYNNEVAVAHPIDLSIEGAVAAKELYELLDKVEDDEIDIEKGGGQLLVKGKKFKAGITMQSEIVLPLDAMEKDKSGEWSVLPAGFWQAVKFCLFSVGKSSIKPLLCYLCIEPHMIRSCDGFRLTQHSMEWNLPKIFLSSVAAGEFAGHCPSEISLGENWIHFKDSAGAVFSSRTLDGDYPDTDSILEVKGKEIVFPSSMVEVLGRAEVLTEEGLNLERLVGVKLEGNQIVVSSESQVGWYSEKFKVEYDGDPVEFFINSLFFREILSHLKKAEMSEDQSKMKFVGDNFVHVVALANEKA